MVTHNRSPLLELHAPSEYCRETRVASHCLDAPSSSLEQVEVLARPLPTMRSSPSFPRRDACRQHDYPLLGFSSPTGYNPYYPLDRLSAPAPPMGSCPLQRMRHREYALPEECSLGTFRLQGFTPSCRVTPPSALRVYFTPVALLGFCPPRVSSSQGAAPSHRCAPCPPGVSSRHGPTSMVSVGCGRP